MLEPILEFDRRLFLYLFENLRADWLSPLMIFLSDGFKTRPLRIFALLLWLWMIARGGKFRLWALLLLPALIVANEACDLLKAWTGRERPCVALPIEALTGKLTSGSFPSAHSANMAAIVGLAGAVWGRRTALCLLAIPFLVGLSRVYVGVHYPLDVMGGWALGGAVGLGTGLSWLAMSNRPKPDAESQDPPPPESPVESAEA